MIAVRTCEFLRLAAPVPFAGFCEDETPVWALPIGPPGNVRSPASAPLAALAGGALAHRFHTWRGASGRRHVVSVFAAADCPDYDEAVFLAVSADTLGNRRILGISGDADTAARLCRDNNDNGQSGEIHVHLLAETPASRAAVTADLAAALSRAEPPARRASRL